jgi:hypothetical protein
MKPIEAFSNACDEIVNAFEEYGFKPSKNYSCSKIADDKDMIYEICFGPFKQFLKGHCPDPAVIVPYFRIHSKQLKRWLIEQTNSKYHSGQIYIAPRALLKEWEWSLAGESYEQSIKEIINEIKLKILPIVEIFKDKSTAIEYLKNNGTKFNHILEKTLQTWEFILCFGGKTAAEMFLKNYAENSELKDRIIDLYRELSKNDKLVSLPGKVSALEWEEQKKRYADKFNELNDLVKKGMLDKTSAEYQLSMLFK